MKHALSTLLPEPVELEIATDADWASAIDPREGAHLGAAVAKRQREFSAGRRCAHRALDALGFAPRSLPPGPDRAPVWPSGAVGSITHTVGFCAAAAARTTQLRSVGIDAEPAERLRERVGERILLPDEARFARDTPPPDGAPADFGWDRVFFSAKESLYKCHRPLGGVFLEFSDAALRFDPAAGSWEGTLQCELPESLPEIRVIAGRFVIAGGYIVTSAWIPRNDAGPEPDELANRNEREG